MQQPIALYTTPQPKFYVEGSENFYQRLNDTSNTIISLQYNPKNFVSFKIYDASQGTIVNHENGEYALKCRVHGRTYLFTREHLDQLSNRERHELFNHLGVNSNQFN
jgi:hypothetical protein